MFHKLLRYLLFFFFGAFLENAERRAVRRIKAKGVSTYIKVVQGVRLSAVGIVSFLVLLQTLTLGFVILCGALLWMAPWDQQIKIYAAIGLGAILFFAPLTLLMIGLSQRIWYRTSGAKNMVDDFLEDSD